MKLLPFEAYGMSQDELQLWLESPHPDHLQFAAERVFCSTEDHEYDGGYVIPVSQGRARGLESAYIAGWKAGRHAANRPPSRSSGMESGS